MTKIKVGIIQQKYSTSKKTNIEMSIEGIHQCASKRCTIGGTTGATCQ